MSQTLVIALGRGSRCPFTAGRKQAGEVGDWAAVAQGWVTRDRHRSPLCSPALWRALQTPRTLQGSSHRRPSPQPHLCPPCLSLLPSSTCRQKHRLRIWPSQQPAALASTYKYLSSELINTEKRPADKTSWSKTLHLSYPWRPPCAQPHGSLRVWVGEGGRDKSILKWVSWFDTQTVEPGCLGLNLSFSAVSLEPGCLGLNPSFLAV